jgi:N6-adenosine-specific RNA methylase IME4
MNRHAANHYPTNDIETIKSLPVQSIAAEDCVLFLWSTNQHLRIAMDVLEAWRFTYKSNYVWDKEEIGTGFWNRSRHEILLIGVRGNPPCPAPGEQWESIIRAPRPGEHSAKPECFLEMIEQYYPTLPKIELNRRGRAGMPGATKSPPPPRHRRRAATRRCRRPATTSPSPDSCGGPHNDPVRAQRPPPGAPRDRLAPLARLPGRPGARRMRGKPDMLREALLCAERGWRVFPVSPGTKRPISEHGVDDATRDREIIEHWWRESPRAMIAVRCGPDSGFWGLDLDVNSEKDFDGLAAFAALRNGRNVPDTRTVETPRGGQHLHFRWNDSAVPLRNWQGKPAPGIDIRTDGGYLIVPPSHNAQGKEYAYLHDGDALDAPVWLIEAILAKDETEQEKAPPPRGKGNGGNNAVYASAALEAEVAKVTVAAPGTRNATLNASAFSLGQLVAGGLLSETEVYDRLFAAAVTNGSVKDDGARAARKTIASGLGNGKQHPRSPPERDQRQRRSREPRPSHDSKSNRPRFPRPLNIEVLSTMTFPPIKNVIPEIIVEGLTLLAGKPKIGKSWLVLHAALAVARGGFTLGDIHCAEGDVLYCALEDNPRRLQARLIKLCGLPPWNIKRLDFYCELPRLADGGLAILEGWIRSKPQPRLIIVDVLTMVRPQKKKDQTNYESDYAAVLQLRELAGRHGIAIVVICHLRKGDSDDAFDTVSGTLGLTGAPDTVLVLKRDAASGAIILYGRGRDLVEIEKAMVFDQGTCVWRIAGEASAVQRTIERASVLRVVDDAGEPLSPSDVAAATGMKVANVKFLLRKLLEEGVIEKVGYGKYRTQKEAA